jgi:hypothetical protein
MMPVTSTPTSPPTPARARTVLVIMLSSVLAAAACDSGAADPAPPIDADTYAEVMAELTDLRRFPPPGKSGEERSERADSIRRAILERHGVTADELLAYAEIVGPDPDRMIEIAERIVTISDSLAAARTGGGRLAGSDSLDALADTSRALDSLGDAATDSPNAAAQDSAGKIGADSTRARFLDRLELPEGVDRRERLRQLPRRGALRDSADAPPP